MNKLEREILGILEEDASCVQYLSHLLRYAKEHRIKAAGDPICRTFLSMNKKENYHRFRQVWLPVEEKPGQILATVQAAEEKPGQFSP